MNSASPTPTPPVVDGNAALSSLMPAIRRILRPLVRLLLARGIGYPSLAAMLKSVYVDVAASEFRIAGKAQTDSRLSLLTGVHRKDVRRLVQEGNDPETLERVPENVSLGARLIARWCGDEEFLDENKRPRVLPRLSRSDGATSFERLVAAESTDIRARAVLDEWLRLGLVQIDDEDRVCLVSEAFVPQAGSAEKTFFLAHNLHDHIAASVHNVLGEQPPLLERSVYYGRLSPSAVAELSTLSEHLGMDALHAINRRARELQQESITAGDTGQRITFGIYFYDEPSASTDKASPHAKSAPQ